MVASNTSVGRRRADADNKCFCKLHINTNPGLEAEKKITIVNCHRACKQEEKHTSIHILYIARAQHNPFFRHLHRRETIINGSLELYCRCAFTIVFFFNILYFVGKKINEKISKGQELFINGYFEPFSTR